jgi:2-methylcitrate dehydratase PrpD
MRGVTGPLEVFEGNKGFMDSIAGRFDIDWSREGLDRVTQTIIKKYNAEIHSRSAIEAALDLKRRLNLTGHEIDQVNIEIFDVAFHIIGGREEGDKRTVHSKEEADHGLPYLIAVALLDGEVMPAQFFPDRVRRTDVQELLLKVRVRPSDEFSRRFPLELACWLAIRLKDGRTESIEKRDYEDFTTNPASWEAALRKIPYSCTPRGWDSEAQGFSRIVVWTLKFCGARSKRSTACQCFWRGVASAPVEPGEEARGVQYTPCVESVRMCSQFVTGRNLSADLPVVRVAGGQTLHGLAITTASGVPS